eukprot:TRINITY_DN54518_c0_g1_i1.p1 TRINITY_DN54518_c0_g1~~TRINITY_DN54518_c0_g1_i1.p1  ORF type:complete len:836 (+),score=106.75 TRINITY_DN54518_c0_g1_i1:22-2508(+)
MAREGLPEDSLAHLAALNDPERTLHQLAELLSLRRPPANCAEAGDVGAAIHRWIDSVDLVGKLHAFVASTFEAHPTSSSAEWKPIDVTPASPETLRLVDHAAAEVGGLVFVFGGARIPEDWEGTAGFFAIDPRTNAVHELSTGALSVIRPRGGHAMVAHQAARSLWVIGGACSKAAFTDCWSIELGHEANGQLPSKARSRPLPSLPVAALYSAVAVHPEAGRIYLFGGRTDVTFSDGSLSASLYSLDFSCPDAWEQISQKPPASETEGWPSAPTWPSARACASMVAYRDVLLLYGGLAAENQILGELWLFPVNNPTPAWRAVRTGDYLPPRAMLASALYGPCWWLFGGLNNLAWSPEEGTQALLLPQQLTLGETHLPEDHQGARFQTVRVSSLWCGGPRSSHTATIVCLRDECGQHEAVAVVVGGTVAQEADSVVVFRVAGGMPGDLPSDFAGTVRNGLGADNAFSPVVAVESCEFEASRRAVVYLHRATLLRAMASLSLLGFRIPMGNETDALAPQETARLWLRILNTPLPEPLNFAYPAAVLQDIVGLFYLQRHSAVTEALSAALPNLFYAFSEEGFPSDGVVRPLVEAEGGTLALHHGFARFAGPSVVRCADAELPVHCCLWSAASPMFAEAMRDTGAPPDLVAFESRAVALVDAFLLCPEGLCGELSRIPIGERLAIFALGTSLQIYGLAASLRRHLRELGAVAIEENFVEISQACSQWPFLGEEISQLQYSGTGTNTAVPNTKKKKPIRRRVAIAEPPPGAGQATDLEYEVGRIVSAVQRQIGYVVNEEDVQSAMVMLEYEGIHLSDLPESEWAAALRNYLPN